MLLKLNVVTTDSKNLLRMWITHCVEACFVHDYLASVKLDDGSLIEVDLIAY